MISPVMPTSNRADVAFEHGAGVFLFDTNGKRYLDFASGIAVTGLGHAHPTLVQALTEQAGKLWHTSNLFRIPGQERLAERLVAHSFADTVFFTNSGVEAWECGVKLIRKHFHAKGEGHRNRIITCRDGFHGRTLAAISSTGQDKMTKGFGPLLDGFDPVPFGNLNVLRAAITEETAAINVEPIQGEAGIRPADPAYLRGLRATADEFGLLLYFDEIQCGTGRTGKLFAHEWAGVQPDVMCIAKGIGGGFPLGACLASEHAASGMTAGSHGTTFGGNPLAMAVGNAVLDVLLEPGFLDTVQARAESLHTALDALLDRWPNIYLELRGQGLMLGLKTGPANTEVIPLLRDLGLLTAPASDNVVRLLPPLILEDEHIEMAIAILEDAARRLS